MRVKRIWLIYLDQIERNDKDATDPTYLMQAFNLTRQDSLGVIAQWQRLRAPKPVDVLAPQTWLAHNSQAEP